MLPVRIQEEKEKNETFFIELYVLKLRTGISYIAAADEDIIFNDNTYVAIPFERGEITKSVDQVTNQCDIKIGDVDDTKLSYLMNGFDFRGCEVAIVRIKYPDSLSDPNICLPVFYGYIDSPAYEEGTFGCVIKNYLPNTQAPQREYRGSCNSKFGDELCCMSLAGETKKVAGYEGNVIHLDGSWPEDYWKDGVITCNGESRIITKSSGADVTVNYRFLQWSLESQDASLIRGCDKNQLTCKKRYNNLIHFSGFPAIPFESTYR